MVLGIGRKTLARWGQGIGRRRRYHDIHEGDGSANSAPPKNVENIEIVKTASRPVWHPGGCIGASNGASTALKLPGKPEIHVFFVRLYTYAGP